MNCSKFAQSIVILVLIASVSACGISPATPTSAPSIPTAISGVSATGQGLSNPISLTFDANGYRSSRGAPLKNGCEGWVTMLKTGESIFASRCDAQRLEELGLYADTAIECSAREIEPRRIVAVAGNYILIDYENEGSQSLYGTIANDLDAYIILNEKKECIYYRAEGTRDQLKELNFLVDALLAANDSVDAGMRVKIVGDRINVAENKLDLTQLLIGETPEGKTVALAVDKNGEYLGHYILR